MRFAIFSMSVVDSFRCCYSQRIRSGSPPSIVTNLADALVDCDQTVCGGWKCIVVIVSEGGRGSVAWRGVAGRVVVLPGVAGERR